MASNYTPSVSPYRVPDNTDAPDVPDDFRQYALRMTAHGMRTRWNASAYNQSSANGEQTCAPGFDGTVIGVTQNLGASTYAPRAMAMVWGFAVVGCIGNAAGDVGITNSNSGGSWIWHQRFHTRDLADSVFTLPVWAVTYYTPGTIPGWSLYMQVDPPSNSVVVREAQISVRQFPINQ